MTSTRAALYLRVSLDATGEHLAVQRQREDCLAIAEARGWEVVAEFVDNSISASDARKNRPGYDALVKAFRAGEFDALVCYDLDRLTRQPRQLEDWIDAATDRGLLLVTANGEADLGTDAGRLFARIKSSVARAEIERKGARQRRAARQRAERGLPPAGVRLTGYTTDGTIIPAEADIVRQLFDGFHAGESLRSLAALMQDSDIPTRRGGRWNPSTVSTILRNPRYAGRAIYQGEAIPAAAHWEPIVSAETFAAVQVRLNDPRRIANRQGTDRKHLGSGIYRCADCDQPVSSFSGGRYRCKDAHVNRSIGPVDTYVLAVIEARLRRPDVRDLLAPDGNANKPLSDRAKALRTRLVQIEADYDDGLIDGRRFRTASEKVQAELDQVDRKLGATLGNTAAASVLVATDPAAAFREAGLMRKRAVLDALVSVKLSRGTRGSRTFNPDTVIIEWKTAA